MEEFLIKTIRFDKDDYWAEFIRNVLYRDKYDLRAPVRRLNYTIRLGKETASEGRKYEVVHTRHRYSLWGSQVKKNYSKHMSFTYVTEDYFPDFFGKGIRDVLVGVLFDAKDALIQRIMLDDGGTYSRTYDQPSEVDAKRYLNHKLKSQEWFTNFEALKIIGVRNLRKHNEVQARVRWNAATSRIVIFTDNLKSRLLAQIRALDLKRNLQELRGDEIFVPIVFYDQDNQSFPEYTLDAQRQDMEAAWSSEVLKGFVFLKNCVEHNIIPDNQEVFSSILDTLPEGKSNRRRMYSIYDVTFRHACHCQYFDILIQFIEKGLRMSSIMAMPEINFLKNYKPIMDHYLIHSVKVKDIKLLKILVKNGGDLAIKDPCGNNLLMRSIFNNDIEMSKFLIKNHSFSLREKNNISETAIHFAIQLSSCQMLKFLYSYYREFVDVILEHEFSKNSIIHMAIQNNDEEVFNYLVSKHAGFLNIKSYFNETPLISASWFDKEIIVAALLKKRHVDINAVDGRGNSALMYAASFGHINIVKYLVKNKNIRSGLKNFKGMTELMCAVIGGNLEIFIKVLEISQNEINTVNLNGDTALILSVQHGYIEMVRLLMSLSDINVNVKNKKGYTAPMLAIAENDNHLFKCIFSEQQTQRVDFDTFNPDGYTLLDKVIMNGNFHMLKIFLKSGCVDINQINGYGETPLITLVTHMVHNLLFPIIFRSDIDLGAVDRHGDGILHIAAKLSDYRMLDMLTSVRAVKLESVNSKRETLLHILAERGEVEMCKLFLEDNVFILNKVTSTGFTALGIAIAQQHRCMVNYLLSFDEIDFFVPECIYSILELADYSEDNEIIRSVILHEKVHNKLLELMEKEDTVGLNEMFRYVSRDYIFQLLIHKPHGKYSLLEHAILQGSDHWLERIFYYLLDYCHVDAQKIIFIKDLLLNRVQTTETSKWLERLGWSSKSEFLIQYEITSATDLPNIDGSPENSAILSRCCGYFA